jgi:hypothetical protein
VAVHTPLHRMPPFAHWQEPFWHAVPPEHSTPQPPQFELSDCPSTHAPAHDRDPGPQIVVHLPPEQNWLLPHAIPQPPQLLGSAFSFTHTPLQSVNPGVQTVLHTPTEQTFGAGQTAPHPPQLFGSLFSLTHAP